MARLGSGDFVRITCAEMTVVACEVLQRVLLPPLKPNDTILAGAVIRSSFVPQGPDIC